MKTQAVTQNLFKPVAVGIALALAANAVITPAHAEDKPYKTETTMAQYVGWGDPDMAKMAVNSGRALLEHLRTADAMLAEGHTAQARNALVASHEFSNAIERMMPYLVVVEQMKDASDHVVQAQADVFSADVLPIYASLNDLQVFAPKVAQKTRAMVNKAERHAAKGDKQAAATILKEAADIVSNETVYLPVDYVNQQVNAALYAVSLPKPDTAAAKLAVQRAMNSLTTVVDTVVQPTG